MSVRREYIVPLEATPCDDQLRVELSLDHRFLFLTHVVMNEDGQAVETTDVGTMRRMDWYTLWSEIESDFPIVKPAAPTPREPMELRVVPDPPVE